MVVTRTTNSAPMMDIRKPKPSTTFAPNLSISFPEIGAPMPENRPRMMTRYPPEPVAIFSAFSENWGMKITLISTKPLTNEMSSVRTMLRFEKYPKFITGSWARFSTRMNTGIRAANTARNG